MENIEESVSNINDSIDDELRHETKINKNDFVENYSDEENSERYTLIDNANKYFLVKILSPEITSNEVKKRWHKDELLKIVKYFLVFQIFLISFILTGIVTMIFVFHSVGNDLSVENLQLIINFVSIYITSIVIEIIAMLKYIIANVFDTSIAGLVEIFKDNPTPTTNEDASKK